jgi:hypothetical protein
VKKSILALLLCLLAVGAGADSLWVYGANLQRSAAGGELTFTLIVNEPRTYQAGLEVQGEWAKDYAVELVLQPESEEAPLTIRFSFAGLDCG